MKFESQKTRNLKLQLKDSEKNDETMQEDVLYAFNQFLGSLSLSQQDLLWTVLKEPNTFQV